ncbi:hypothetical protein GN244_ATG00608 [Phytophthora infestans]|uniref:Uncharacterized protein n=1 Tax=Phytophthora infestans TaxID=4787 RepID=A0A833TPW7_PHYIN|nr:hypothetical protein GN244_ATG00608 [Phytophthora infestans]
MTRSRTHGTSRRQTRHLPFLTPDFDKYELMSNCRGSGVLLADNIVSIALMKLDGGDTIDEHVVVRWRWKKGRLVL